MLDEKLSDRAKRLVEAQLPERREQLCESISRIVEEMNARGMLFSGATVKRISSICAREIEIRGLLVWSSLRRAHQALGFPHSTALSADFKEIMRQDVESAVLELIPVMDKECRRVRYNGPKFKELNEAEERTLAKLDVEIDLYVDCLEQQPEPAKGSSAPLTYKFEAPVGVVQTGSSASANVVQILNNENKQELIDALKQVDSSLRTLRETEAPGKEEIVAIVKEAMEELQKPKPNGRKITSFLRSTGTFIATISAMQSAYELLKPLLLRWGIVLP